MKISHFYSLQNGLLLLGTICHLPFAFCPVPYLAQWSGLHRLLGISIGGRCCHAFWFSPFAICHLPCPCRVPRRCRLNRGNLSPPRSRGPISPSLRMRPAWKKE